MSLLIIGLALAGAHLLGRYWRRPRQRLMNFWFSRIVPLFRGQSRIRGAIGVLLMVGLPAAAVGVAQYLLADYNLLAWFGFSLLALLFAWGPRDLDRDVLRYLQADSEDSRRAATETLTFSYRQPVPEQGRAGVIKGVFYQSLVRWFGVIFWFLLLGAAGAIVFRLAHSMLCEPRNRVLLSSAQAQAARAMVAVLDLLPATLTTLALAMVGDFDSVASAWRRHFGEREGSAWNWDYEFLPEVGYQTVMHGDAVEEAFSHDFEGALAKVNQAMSLVWRVLVCWMTVIALLILAGLLS